MVCTIATASPVGVVTMSISGYTFSIGLSKTTIAKADVPADTLPVRTRTLLVATMPVPASPSGGQSGIPANSVPLGSNSLAPFSVKTPACSPASKIFGKTSDKCQE